MTGLLLIFLPFGDEVKGGSTFHWLIRNLDKTDESDPFLHLDLLSQYLTSHSPPFPSKSMVHQSV